MKLFLNKFIFMLGLFLLWSNVYAENGGVNITIYPQEVVDAGASYEIEALVVGFIGPYSSGLDIGELEPGHVTIHFPDIEGWVTPEPLETVVVAGQIVNESVTYTRQIIDDTPDVTVKPTPNQGTTDCSQVTEVLQAECESLLELYYSTDGANWLNNDGWNVSNTPCSWHGVDCENNHITFLGLGNNNLSGNISDLNGLSGLQRLYLDENKITGSIPNISALTNLYSLGLEKNELSGSIPDLSTLLNLENIWLNENQLTGSIPNLSMITKLTSLTIDNNKLEGEIPLSLMELSNLSILTLNVNCLTTSEPTLIDFLDDMEPSWVIQNNCSAISEDIEEINENNNTDITDNYTISGTISLPEGYVVPKGGIDLFISTSCYEGDTCHENGIDWSKSGIPLIPENHSSSDFKLFITDNPNIKWKFGMGCVDSKWDENLGKEVKHDKCQGYMIDAFWYTLSGMKRTFIDNMFPLSGGQNYSNVNFVLLRTVQISGTVSLPKGEVAPTGGLEILIYTGEYVNGIETVENPFGANDSVIIPEGESTISYTLTIVDDPKIEWVIYYSGDDSFEKNGYKYWGYYSTTGMKGEFIPDVDVMLRLQGGQNHSNIDLTLIPIDAETPEVVEPVVETPPIVTPLPEVVEPIVETPPIITPLPEVPQVTDPAKEALIDKVISEMTPVPETPQPVEPIVELPPVITPLPEIPQIDEPTQESIFDRLISIITPPRLPEINHGDKINGYYTNGGSTVTEDFTLETGSSIGNLTIEGKVVNHGLMSNVVVEKDAELTGGKLTGYIENNGVISDFEFVGASITGGTLSGHIYNNSKIGGSFIDVTLSAGTIIEGGILEGIITGDCDAKPVLKNVIVKAASVLKCVDVGDGNNWIEYPVFKDTKIGYEPDEPIIDDSTFYPSSEILKKAKEIGIDVENISYELYLMNEGTPAHPKQEKTSLRQGENKFEEKCVHGDVYKLYLRLGNDTLLPFGVTYASSLIPHLEKKIKFSLTTSTYETKYETKPTTAYQTNTQNIEKILLKETFELAEIVCQHHATSEKPLKLEFNQLDVEYKNTMVGNMNLSEILGNLGSGNITFLPKTHITDILKNEVKFSSKFSPSNALLGATLSELSYYDDEEFVTTKLEDAGFYNVKYYEYTPSSSISKNYNFYVATKKQENDNVPIIYITIRGTEILLQDIVTDLLAVLTAPSILNNSEDLNEFEFNARINYNYTDFPFAATFYNYANFVYYAIMDDYTNGLIDVHKGQGKLFITGHSLGAATANILTTLLATSVDTDNMMTYTIGSPDSIVSSLAEKMNRSDFNIFNIIHPTDPVPKLPAAGIIVDNIIELSDFRKNTDYLELANHGSNVYINSLYYRSTENKDNEEQIATENDIFERGTCRRNHNISKFGVYGFCHIDAEILKLEGQLDGNNVETYYIDNISHNINPPPRVSKYEPSHHMLNYENDAEIQEVINGVFNRNNFELEGIKYNFADLGLKVNPVNQCRVYANGNFTCFNVKSEGTKGEDYYFKFEPDNAVYKLDKKEETKHPNFHFLGIHGK